MLGMRSLWKLIQIYGRNLLFLEQISADDIMQSIQEMPPGYRMVLNLYAIEGFTHKEIAEELNISEGTSKSQLARGRKYLSEYLASKNHIYGKSAT